jgi:hypothetical protein
MQWRCGCKGELTYHMGLRLAVMALGVEAALILASGRGRLEMRWDSAGGHIEDVCRVVVKGEVEGSRSARRSGLVLKEQGYQGLCWRGVDVGQERASNQQGRTGVNAELVQLPWTWRILYVIPIYTSRRPWQ